MKAITVAIWIDTWEITQNSMYNDEMEIKIDTFTIKNIAKQCMWYHTFWNALNYSCNVWMIRIAQKVWKVLMYDYFNDFWFWEITKIDLTGEVSSKIKPWERWSVAQLLTSSYGLWVSATPIQLAAAYSVIANGWVYIRPSIIEEIRFPDWKIVKYKSEEERRVIKESTSKIVSTMLQDWCVNWVAKNWYVEWYDVWCKSGTAQIAYKWIYETWVWSTIWTFAWFGPIEDPKFVIIVKLDRIRTSSFGWETSWHIFAEVSKYLFDYYGIPKKEVKKEEVK
jgi:cell division protein FtsI/penicillin-binding protein 2